MGIVFSHPLKVRLIYFSKLGLLYIAPCVSSQFYRRKRTVKSREAQKDNTTFQPFPQMPSISFVPGAKFVSRIFLPVFFFFPIKALKQLCYKTFFFYTFTYLLFIVCVHTHMHLVWQMCAEIVRPVGNWYSPFILEVRVMCQTWWKFACWAFSLTQTFLFSSIIWSQFYFIL